MFEKKFKDYVYKHICPLVNNILKFLHLKLFLNPSCLSCHSHLLCSCIVALLTNDLSLGLERNQAIGKFTGIPQNDPN